MTRITWLVMILLGSSVVSVSQTDSLPSDQLEVMKRFRSSLGKNERIRVTPAPPEIDTTPRRYEYRFQVIDVETPEVVAELQYDELTLEDLYDPFHGIIKLGYGLPNQPYGLISIGQNKPASHQWNTNIRHQQYGREGAFQDYSSTNGTVSGSVRIHDDWAVSGNLGLSHRRHQYYPLRGDTLYEESDVDRTLFRLSPSLGIEGYTGLWKHSAQLKYGFNKDNEGPRQHDARISVDSRRSWGNRGNFEISLDGQIGEVDQDSIENSINYIYLKTAWSQSWQRWSSRLGVSVLSGSSTLIFPDVQLGFMIDEQKAQIRIFATGTGQPLSLSSILDENPFLDPDSEIDALQGIYDFGASLSGRLGSLNYEVTGGYQKRIDQHLFVNDSVHAHLFDLIIDDVTQWKIATNIEMDLGRTSTVGINIEKMFLEAKNQEKPYHLPGYNLFIFTTHHLLGESLLIKPSLKMTGGLSFREENTTKTLEPVVDLGLNIRYRFNDHWSLFLDGSNLLNQRNPRFNGYDSIGTMLLAGIMYKL